MTRDKIIQNLSCARAVFAGSKIGEDQLGQRIAIYCRVSTSSQSCDRQELELRAYAERACFDIVEVYNEVASGAKDLRPQRKKAMALAQDRRIDAILVTELTRWGRSTLDLVQTLNDLQAWSVSLIAQTGLQFDVRTAQGKLIASMMAALAEFERDLLRERIRSGIAAAKANGKTFGRKAGDRPKSDRQTPKVLHLLEKGSSYRAIAWELNLNKNTVMGIVHRNRKSV